MLRGMENAGFAKLDYDENGEPINLVLQVSVVNWTKVMAETNN